MTDNWLKLPSFQLQPALLCFTVLFPRAGDADALMDLIAQLFIKVFTYSLLSHSPLSLPLSLPLSATCWAYPLKLLRIRRTCCMEYANQFVCIERQSKNHIEKHLHLHDSTVLRSLPTPTPFTPLYTPLLPSACFSFFAFLPINCGSFSQ